jgi:beta-barrel assembly-enhancing protease
MRPFDIRRRALAFALVSLALGCATTGASAQGSGLNLFSAEQDVELGREAARQIESQVRVLRHTRATNYVEEIVHRLTAQAPGARFDYQVKLLDASDINAFALPGGFVYVNRGLVEAVRSEGELAGVLAHEIAHVAMRHGTRQATKAAGAQAGLSVLQRILGRNDNQTGKIVGVAGGIGLNAAFLKFGRDDEREADRVGAQMMASAGYDPEDMARFFDLLAAQRRSNPGRVEQFFSSHPSPGDRAALIRQAGYRREHERDDEIGGLTSVQRDLRRLPPAPGPRRTAR